MISPYLLHDLPMPPLTACSQRATCGAAGALTSGDPKGVAQALYAQGDYGAARCISGHRSRCLHIRPLLNAPLLTSRVRSSARAEVLENCMRGRVLHAGDAVIQMAGLEGCLPRLVSASRIIICACGTSWHAGLVGEYLIETLARIPVEVCASPATCRFHPLLSHLLSTSTLAPIPVDVRRPSHHLTYRPHHASLALTVPDLLWCSLWCSLWSSLPRSSTPPSSVTGGPSSTRMM